MTFYKCLIDDKIKIMYPAKSFLYAISSPIASHSRKEKPSSRSS